MKFSLKVVFGKEQIIKIHNNEPLTANELENNLKEYFFVSKEDKESFLRGLNEGIGWTECCIPEIEINTLGAMPRTISS